MNKKSKINNEHNITAQAVEVAEQEDNDVIEVVKKCKV